MKVATELPAMEPMLVTERPLPIGQGGWAYEVKWDGHRSLVFAAGEGPAKLASRAGLDTTARYPEISVAIGEMLDGVDAIIDGEIVCFGPDGKPSLRLLQDRCYPFTDNPKPNGARAVFVAFDILWYCGMPLTGWSYEARRGILGKLPLAAPLAIIPPAWGDAEPALQYTKDHGLEGVVAKRLSSPYLPGKRTHYWVKHRHGPFVA